MLTPLSGILLILMTIAGMVLILLGAIGRFIAIPPGCARCGYRIGGDPAALERACPECGVSLAAAGSVRYFARRVKVRPIIFGALLMLLAIGMSFIIGRWRTTPSGGPWGSLAAHSVAQLTTELSADPGRAIFALQELSQRARAGTLTPQELRLTLDALLVAGKQDAAQWMYFESSGILSAAHAAGVLDESTLGRLGILFDPPPPPTLPKQVRQGTGIPLILPSATMIGGVHRQTDLLSLRDGQGAGALFLNANHEPIERLSSDAMPGIDFVRFDCPPGRYELTADFEVRYSMGPRPRGPGSGTSAPVAAQSLRIPLVVEVLAADAPSPVALETEAARAAEVRAACVIEQVFLVRRPDGLCELTVDARIEPVTGWALAYDLVVELDGNPIPFATIVTIERNGLLRRSRTSLLRSRIPWPSEEVDHVRIELRPNPRAVETMPDVGRIWGETLLFPDQPLLRIDGAVGKGAVP